VKIHYKNYHTKYDTWIDRNTNRIRPYGRTKDFVYARNKNAVLWSLPSSTTTTSAPVMTAADQFPRDTTTIGSSNRQPITTSESKSTATSSSSSSEPGRVRYIGDESRTRKIADASEQYNAYRKALEDQQYSIHRVDGDGNCLFRAIAHQVYGNDAFHFLVRQKCLDYMESEASFFSQFVVGGMTTFPLYLEAKRRDGCWGDDPEIEAICELYNRPAEIWAYDSAVGARKLRTFHETSQYTRFSNSNTNAHNQQTNNNNSNNTNNNTSSSSNNNQREIDPADDNGAGNDSIPMIKLSYYGGGHYDSIVDANHLYHIVQETPGEYEDRMIGLSHRRCHRNEQNRDNENNEHRNTQTQQRTSEIEAQNQANLELAIQESRRLQSNLEYDDLETCLALSLSSSSQSHHAIPPLYLADSKIPSSSQQGKEDEKGEKSNPVVDEAVALQGDVLKSVQEESEREYLDQAILASLGATTTPSATTAAAATNNNENVEDQMLQAALLSSAKEIEEKQQQEEKNMDKDLEMALKLSNLSEEEVLQLALEESMKQQQKGISSTTPQMVNQGELTEEELLRIAMEESLKQSFPHQSTSNMRQSSTQTSSNSNNNLSAQQNPVFVGEEDFDEDLMRAIQESLKK
jgi:hypothetical protein